MRNVRFLICYVLCANTLYDPRRAICNIWSAMSDVWCVICDIWGWMCVKCVRWLTTNVLREILDLRRVRCYEHRAMYYVGCTIFYMQRVLCDARSLMCYAIYYIFGLKFSICFRGRAKKAMLFAMYDFQCAMCDVRCLISDDKLNLSGSQCRMFDVYCPISNVEILI
jgi:hypothetical protein